MEPLQVYTNYIHELIHIIKSNYNQNILFRLSQGLSGRTLRKIPFLACSVFTHCIDTTHNTLSMYLDAMKQTIQKQFDDRSVMPQ